MVSLHNWFEKLVVKSHCGLEGYLSLCLFYKILTRFVTDCIIEFLVRSRNFYYYNGSCFQRQKKGRETIYV